MHFIGQDSTCGVCRSESVEFELKMNDGFNIVGNFIFVWRCIPLFGKCNKTDMQKNVFTYKYFKISILRSWSALFCFSIIFLKMFSMFVREAAKKVQFLNKTTYQYSSVHCWQSRFFYKFVTIFGKKYGPFSPKILWPGH